MLLSIHMIAQRWHRLQADQQDRQPERGKNQKRDLPAEASSQLETERDSEDRREGERGHQDAGRPPPPLFREDVADDRQGQPAQNPSERPRDDPRQPAGSQ